MSETDQRRLLLNLNTLLTEQEAEQLLFDWDFWAREKQLPPPGDWSVWLILAGRGFGKTRTGVEWVRDQVESGKAGRVGFIGQTAADVRDVMIEGESGLLAVSPPWFKPKYEPSKRRITWPNGAVGSTFSGDEPDQLRGPQFAICYADEPAKWKYATDAWDNMEFGLRLGDHPQVVATTTPRPIPLIKALVADPRCVVTRGNTYENIGNLAPVFIDRVIGKYEGTRLGRQELNAEILDDNPNALWKRDIIEKFRVRGVPDLVRIVVAVDVQVADPNQRERPEAEDKNAETGIVVAGVTAGPDPHGFVLDDCSLSGSPNEWGNEVLTAFNKWKCDRVIAEINNGGAMVEFVMVTVARDNKQTIPYKGIHASRGKQTRAEPVAALYEQGKIHHVGAMPTLEDQMCLWEPGQKSPDRMDALVWAIWELMLQTLEKAVARPSYQFGGRK